MPLLTIHTLPPGGWRYKQLRPDGTLFKYFHSMGPYTDFIAEVNNVRKGNGFPRATEEEVSVDVQKETCDRLGNDPRYCTDGSGAVSSHPVQVQATVRGCCGGGRRA